MKTKFLVTAAVALLCAAPATAAITVLGSTSARMCFEAAESKVIPSRDSLAQCDEALRQEALDNRDTVATHVNRGILRARLRDIRGAISDFDTASSLDPDEPEAYLNKGMVLMRQSSADAALPLFTMALEKKTRRPALAYFGRGVANEDLGNVRSAYFDYRAAIRADPKWKDPRLELTRFQVSR
jgi:tetratricopeptide (TPR) repeat protein